MLKVLHILHGIISVVYLTGIILLSGCGDGAFNGHKTVTISGIVTFENRPVSGAAVYFVIPGKTFNDRHHIEKKSLTQSDGSFSFSVNSDKFTESASPHVVIYSPYYAVTSYDLSKGTNYKSIKVNLAQADSLSGIVKDENGNPINDAEIRITLLYNGQHQYHPVSCVIPEMTFYSDEKGAFTVKPVPPKTKVRLEITATGYALEQREPYPSGTSGYTYLLVPEGRIEGTVTYGDTGESASNIKVCATDGSSPRPRFVSEIAVTDADGHYSLKNIPPFHCSVGIIHENNFPEWLAKSVSVNVLPGAVEKNIDLRLIKGGVISGRITDDTGEPIPEYHVGYYNQRANFAFLPREAITDIDGYYQFRCIPGDINIWLYSPQTGEYYPQRKSKDITLADGETVEQLDFQFEQGVTVTGKVVAPDGNPIEGAVITHNETKAEGIWNGNVTTDSYGSFTLTGVRKGETLPVLIEHKELNIIYEEEIDPEKEVIVRLEFTGAAVQGRVVGEQGEPLAGTQVGLHLMHQNARTHSFNTVTDGSGVYRFMNVPTGNKFAMTANAPGYRERGVAHSFLTQDTQPLQDMILFKNDRWLEGTITDWKGRPVVGAYVEVITGCCDEGIRTYTDTDGKYRIDGLFRLVEPYMRIRHKEYGHYIFSCARTNQRNDFTFVETPNYIAGKVVDTNKKPVNGAIVRLYPEQHESGRYQGSGSTKSDGSFRIDNVIGDVITVSLYGYDICKEVRSNTEDIILVRDETFKKKNDRQKYKAKEDQMYVLEGRPSPELTVPQWFNTESGSLPDIQGNIVLLCFWSVGKPESIESLDYVKALGEMLDGEVTVIGIHEYTTDTKPVLVHLQKKGIRFPVAIDRKSHRQQSHGLSFDAFRFVDFPLTMIIDSDGLIHTDGYGIDTNNGTIGESGFSNLELDVQQKLRRMIVRKNMAKGRDSVKKLQAVKTNTSQKTESLLAFKPTDAVIIENGSSMEVREAIIKLNTIYDVNGKDALIPAIAPLVKRTTKDLSTPQLSDLEEKNLEKMMELLGRSGDSHALAPLMNYLCGDRIKDYREADIDLGVEGIRRIGSAAFSQLADSLKSSRFIPGAVIARVLAGIAETDSSLFTDRDREMFRQILHDNAQHEKYEVRMYSAAALGFFGNDSSVQLLGKLKNDDPAVLPWRKSEHPVRKAAEQSLNMISARGN